MSDAEIKRYLLRPKITNPNMALRKRGNSTTEPNEDKQRGATLI